MLNMPSVKCIAFGSHTSKGKWEHYSMAFATDVLAFSMDSNTIYSEMCSFDAQEFEEHSLLLRTQNKWVKWSERKKEN